MFGLLRIISWPTGQCSALSEAAGNSQWCMKLHGCSLTDVSWRSAGCFCNIRLWHEGADSQKHICPPKLMMKLHLEVYFHQHDVTDKNRNWLLESMNWFGPVNSLSHSEQLQQTSQLHRVVFSSLTRASLNRVNLKAEQEVFPALIWGADIVNE